MIVQIIVEIIIQNLVFISDLSNCNKDDEIFK